MLFNKILLVFLSLVIINSSIFANVKVKGYYRKNGTYVQSHYRSNPDGNFNNNWSTVDNVNPYTGEYGTKTVNPNKEQVYLPSTVKELNIPYTTTYSSINPHSKQNQSTYSNSASKIPAQPYIGNTTQKFKKTEYPSSTPNLSSLEMLELESRIRSNQRLKSLGYSGDTSNLSNLEMIELESRIRSNQRLKSLGYSGDTSNLSNLEMLELESRIRSSQRLKNLGY
ncbi:hypothetical protein H0920_09310 [Acinetobacter sp. C_4_1]|uniref:hypothetical protein n=1 Tax=Acinetobacter sp. C_4_1 TaxID=2755321 RepID=UPI0021BB01F6|nr:hypothetical protein [Acinetobacter sp. C_4_1]MCT8101295.1 hypothetical protein [Acinetobacter sp. C_4_1]